MQIGESASGSADQRLALVHEMSSHNYDLIRFASYRTAVKLRFIQKKVCLHAVDIWNVIEAFREQGLHALEPSYELSVARLETLLCSLYHSLNKRAPPSQQANVEICSSLLLNWLLAAYATVDNIGKIRVFSIKVALATLCAGKLMDKLRYVFSQVSDSNGLLLQWKFNEYLQEILALPAAVYESPTFSYTDSLASTIFSPNAKVTVNDFLDVMMCDPGPPVLLWLPLLHRIASVENVVHPMQCDSCLKDRFCGFRYRCMKCPHYTLCQDCFWRGRVSSPHALDHQVKEYASFSPNKTIGQSLRKSFRCVPEKPKNHLPKFPEQPEKTLNLSHIVPPSPVPSHNGFPDTNSCNPFDGMGSLDSRSSTTRSLDSARDDEHRLIARYAAKLAQEASQGMGRVASEACLGMDSTRAQRELIGQLEAKNREIMREIARLRRQQELEGAVQGPDNPLLMNELRALRMRKDELETHLSSLQDSRRQLMIQLEGLMKMLKNHQASPRSTPNSSPRSTKSPPLPSVANLGQANPRSAPQTPSGMPSSSTSMTNSTQSNVGKNDSMMNMGQPMMDYGHCQPILQNKEIITNMQPMDRGENIMHALNSEMLMGVGNDVRDVTNSFNAGVNMASNNCNGNRDPMCRSLRNDLLEAADSVTNAMSTLVRELNSDFEDDGEDESDGGWQEELQRRYEQDANFMAELRARQVKSPSSNPSEGYPGYMYQQNSVGQHYAENNYGVTILPNSQQNNTGNSQNFTSDEYIAYNRANCNPRSCAPQSNPKQYSQETENRQGFSMQEQNQDKRQFEEALKQWVNR